MATVVKYNAKKRTYTGTKENDVLDASIWGYEPIGKINIKKNRGLTITGGNGDDKITGTDYNDTIKGGNGNDTISGGFGVDTITGGAGVNVINYSKGDGNDIINLTKGENFTLNFTDLTKDDLRFEFTNKNKDLRIYTSKTSDDEYITIKNFVKKDVTNNSNNRKGISDTSSVELMFNNAESSRIDLRTATDLYKTEIVKNYTGTWLSEEIDASDTILYKNVKQGKKKVTVEKDVIDTGLTIKGGAGDDTITGTDYSDKIYGNTGTDTINAGTGNNYIYLNKGDGNDIIENGGGVDTLVFAKKTNLTYSYDKYDLIIKYSDNNTVTLKDYLKGHSVQYVQIGKTKTDFNPPQPTVEEYQEDGYNVFNGSEIADTITGTNNNDNIYGNDGNDSIYAKKGADIIDGGAGVNNYSFISGDGNDIIVNGAGTDTIEFDKEYDLSYSKYLNGDDLIISYGDNDSITLKDYFVNNSHSAKTIFNGNIELNISEEVTKGYNLIGTESAETFDGTVDIPFTYVVNGGNDIIQNSKNTDAIKLDTQETISYSKASNSDDLVITYGDNNVTVKDYFNTDTCVQRIVNRTTTLNIAEELENKLEIVIPESETSITGTTNNDTIYLKDNGITLTVSEGNGNDTVYSGTSEDTLVINNKTFDDLSYEKLGNDLVINYSDNDSITLKNYFTEEHSVKNITAGGNTELLADKIKLYFNGTNNAETITGTDYDDIINSNRGNDTIDGGMRNDTYVFNTGDGTDTIINSTGTDTIEFNESQVLKFSHEMKNNDLVILYGNNDKIILQNYYVNNSHSVKNIDNNGTVISVETAIAQYGISRIYENQSSYNTIEISNYSFDDISYVRNSNDLLINWGTNDEFLLKDYFNNNYTDNNHTIRNIIANGEEDLLSNRVTLYIDGTNSSETINGTKYDDIITPNGGTDTIDGKSGNNTYVFKIGDGTNNIVNGTGTDKVILPNNSTIKLSRSMSNQDLTINYGMNSNVVLKDYFVNSNHSVKSIVINDTEKTLSNLITEYGLEYTGTNSGETINGSSGNDIITGGKGNDTLNGNLGDDIYVFSSGDGADTINATVGEDIIWFKTQVSNLRYAKYFNNQDLIISYGTNDSITIKGYFSGTSSIKNIKNGNTIYSIENSIEQLGFTMMGTDSNDNITGTDDKDIIDGRKGSDIIYGGEGNDIIYGGKNDTGTVYGIPGNDTIYGEDGDDIIFTSKGYEYMDVYGTYQTIYSSNYIDGGDGDDKIHYYNGNNTIIGGKGNDDIFKEVGYLNNSIGENIMLFNVGDGNDKMYGGTSSDTIQFNDFTLEDLKWEKSDTDLIIKYGNEYSDSIKLIKFFETNYNNRILKDNNEITSSIIDIANIPTTANGGSYLNDTYTLTALDLNPTITTSGGDDTLYFENTAMEDLECRIVDNDFYVGFNKVSGTVRNWVLLKDYMLYDFHSVKYIKSSDDKLKSIQDAFTITQGFTIENNKITGTRLNDRISASSTTSEIYGGKGNDTIIGSNDGEGLTISGGKDNDNITVGTTKTILLFECGDGNDTIINCKETDTLKFNNIDLDTLTWSKNKDDLRIGYGNNDTIILKDYFLTGYDIKLADNNYESSIYKKVYMNPNAIEPEFMNYGQIQFKDNIENHTVEYKKHINMQPGAGYLHLPQYVSTGYDLRIDPYNENSDWYKVYKEGNEFFGTYDEENHWNTPSFFELIVSTTSDNININYGYTGIAEVPISAPTVKEFIFTKDTIIGNNTDNIINGKDISKIIGGKGDDYIYAGYENTIEFNKGDGHDILYVTNSSDTLQFNEINDFNYEKFGDDLLIKYNADADSLLIKNLFTNELPVAVDIDTLFITGNTYTTNNINGTTYNDIINGGELSDTIDGGIGNNELYGGSGNDIYVNSDLTNFDTIYDESGDNDQINITYVNKSDLVLRFDLQIDEDGNILDYLSKNMYITSISDFGNTSKGIKVADQFIDGHSIETITTADNYSLTTTQINQLRSDIAAWLHDGGFGSVQEIIDSNNQTNINNLIAEFQKANWQQANV